MTASGLIVPVDLVAFCVGTTDGAERTKYFAGTTVNYLQLTDTNPNAFMGFSATRGFENDALHPLDAGVHLHWALPDALTRATADEKTPLAFPSVPNRWLVTRIVVSGGTLTSTSIVVESDALNDNPPVPVALAVPAKTNGSSLPRFPYLGTQQPLATYQPGAGAYRDATGNDFTAVANGLTSFAAYYPESRNALGILDTLEGVTGPAHLMYVVTGWHDDTRHDPTDLVRRGKVRGKTLAESHRWAVADPPPAYTLYSGMLQGVLWDPNRSYVLPPEEQPWIDADATIANSPTEALAAYFRNTMHPTAAYSEQLLTAFQQGLWQKFGASATDVIPKIAEMLHDTQFRKIDSGLIYSVYQRGSDGKEQEAIDLPTPIADALNDLNAASAALLETQNHVQTFQWQAFADWNRYFRAGTAAQQSAILTHLTQTLNPQWTGDSGLQTALANAQTARDARLAALKDLLKLRSDLDLRQEPGPRYWQPSEPAVLLVSKDLAMPARYGGDGAHREDGQLACRTTGQTVTQVTINGVSMSASSAVVAAASQITSNTIPYPGDCASLLAEACLLNAEFAASWSKADQGALTSALETLLDGGTQALWNINAGTLPSPAGVNDWGTANPWLPVFLTWITGFVPLQPTVTGNALTNYDPAFFTANYTVTPDTGSFLSYTPQGPHGITLDPAKATYGATYQGQTVLSGKAAANFAGQLEDYLNKQSDTTLQAIHDALVAPGVNFMVQPLAGFTESLVNRHQQLQFSLVAPQGANFEAQIMTQTAAAIVGNTYHVGPEFTRDYNPIRAGYFKVTLAAIDAYGQRRPINLTNVYLAESMTTVINGGLEAGIAYAAPRIAQPSRLLFQWMSAAGGNIAEVNDHPATSPICGWLLPNHLTGGFFLYDGAGRPLGSLFVAGDDASGTVVWQGAPGDDTMIDEPIAQALASANPQLRDVALQLFASSATDFRAFYKAVDRAHGSVNPANLAPDAGLSVLVGRPVALVQAALRLDLRGRPYLNQNSACFVSSQWTDTENGLSNVTFPVILGDLDRLDDGLIGYFRGNAGGGYDVTTFFTAATESTSGPVAQPTPSTLLLTLTPTLNEAEPQPVAQDTTRVLMLVDPRAPVHAMTGILPTQSLKVPPDLASSALSTLEFSFLLAPVLKSGDTLPLPTPRESGFDVSFLEQHMLSGKPEWVTLPAITPPSVDAMWNYTPQTLTEGWLRFNPTVLAFTLLNSAGKPVVQGGSTQTLTLRVANRKPAGITLKPGVLAPEGTPAQGAILYVHFGTLVAPADIPAITLSADGWSFAQQSDAVYGTYFAATPLGSAVALDPDASVDIAVSGLKGASDVVEAHVFVDYYAIEGISDGVFIDTVTVQQPSKSK